MFDFCNLETIESGGGLGSDLLAGRLLIADSVTHTNASVVVIILPKSTNVFQINFITMTSFD